MPVGGAWSIDVRREWAAPTSAKTPTAWPLRLLQLQVALVMLTAALWKLEGDDWTNGTALHYVTRLDGLWGNLPLPDQFYSSLVLRAGCWATLCIEVCVPILVWFSSSRRAALMTAVLFHLALAYAMNLFLFEWIMILGWCAFLRSEDFQYVRHGWFSLRGTLNGFEREPS
jgi:hypothetical protein